MATQITKPQVIINKMTKSQYNEITPNEGELYFITDETVDASEVTGLANVAKTGDYNDLTNKPTEVSGDSTDFGTIDVTNNIVTISDAPIKRSNMGAVFTREGLEANVNNGNGGLVVGVNNNSLGDGNFIAGTSNSITNSNRSIVGGIWNQCISDQTLMVGTNLRTTAGDSKVVFGKYNDSKASDPDNTFPLIFGWGSDETSRLNILEMSSGGKLWTKNDVYAGGSYNEPTHKLSEKITDAPSDGKTYGRKNANWVEVTGGGGGGGISEAPNDGNAYTRKSEDWHKLPTIIPVGNYKGTVPDKDSLPMAPFVQRADTNTTTALFKYFFNFVDDTHVNGMTITVEPGADSTYAVWFRNNETWHRASIGGVADTNISIDGVTLADIGYTCDLTTFGKGKTKANITFNTIVTLTPTSTLRVVCRTWGGTDENGDHNNEYTLTDITLSLSELKPILTGTIYKANDTGLYYIYNNSVWEEYEVIANHTYLDPTLQPIGGTSVIKDLSIREGIETSYDHSIGNDTVIIPIESGTYLGSSNYHNYIYVTNSTLPTKSVTFSPDMECGKYTLYGGIFSAGAIYVTRLSPLSSDSTAFPMTTIAGDSTSGTSGTSAVTTVFITPDDTTTSGKRMYVHYMRY